MKGRQQFYKIIALGTILLASVVVTGLSKSGVPVIKLPLQTQTQWADSVLQKMTIDEKIGQLFMVRANSDKGADHTRYIKNLITTYKIGGLCFFQGTAEKQIELINEYQKLASPVPLMISMDAEWGPAMRFKTGVVNFPKQMTMGAIQDNRIIYQFGKEVARELSRIGVHINFAPDVDVNNNVNNPVIATRSFSENKYVVSQKAYMYMLGMQSSGVMACAKHFPGHGDTNVDSHYDVPVLPFDQKRLEELEMYPFKVMINQGVQSVMIGHLVVPALDSTRNVPASLSKPIITGWLKERLGFEGLVFTDALDMKGVTKNFGSGQIEVKALLAGVDVLLLPENVEVAVKAIKAAIKSGALTEERINESVKKILEAKYRFGLTSPVNISNKNIASDLYTGEARTLKQKMIEQAITMVKNNDQLVPVANIEKKIATLSIGSDGKAPFQTQVDAYCKAKHFNYSTAGNPEGQKNLLSDLDAMDLVIVGVTALNNSNKDNFKLAKGAAEFVAKLSDMTKVILIVYGNPYSLSNFIKPNSVLCAYNDDALSQSLGIQAVFGGLPILGKLPVTALPYPFESGLNITTTTRISFGEPESVGMDSETLNRLDELANDLIKKQASPGCELLVMKDGKVVYSKQFGKYTYSNKSQAVNESTLYDLASVTKVAATTMGIMKLYENRKLDVYKYLGTYLPELRGSNKEFMAIRDVMAHRAGLFPWIPFYKETLVNDGNRTRPSSYFYNSKKSDVFNIKVASRMYMRGDYVNSIWDQIITGQNLQSTDYRYSDLGFIMLRKVVEEVSGMPMNKFLDDTYYRPMGLYTMTFKPLEKFPLSQIAPTEDDRYFRQQVLQGDVHDMAAAMLGGVSGHAGLFSNSIHLATLMQMLINGGTYGGLNYLKPETIKVFTTRHPGGTRRGLGFDMPQTDWSLTQNVTAKASRETFGHIGFTGTAVWADPQEKLVFVFLSNRTYPTMDNNLLERRNYRMKAHAIAYDAINKYDHSGDLNASL